MSNLSHALDYFRYRAKAKTKYDIHSPFVFDLVTKVIHDKRPRPAYAEIEKLRGELLKDETIIHIKDLGAGSQKNNSSQRKVKEICRNAAKNKKYAQLLYRLAEHFQPSLIIELGTSLGISTLYLAKAVPFATVITLEGCPETAAIAKKNFDKSGHGNIELVVDNFDQSLPQILTNHKQQTTNPVVSPAEPNKLFFLDGNHRKEPTLRYFEQCLSVSNNESIFIFDDIHWSGEMEKAWHTIKKHPSVTVTIDLFQLGIVFLRKEQAKEDFVIRF